MTRIEIEYCVPCGLLHPALTIEETLLEEFGQHIDEVTVTTGTGGILAVRMDDHTIYNNKRDGAEIDLNQLKETIDGQLDVTA